MATHDGDQTYTLLGDYADLYARWCAEYWDEPQVAQAFLWAQFEGRPAQSVYDDTVRDVADLREKVRKRFGDESSPW
jgi:hypothetical protein